MRVAVAGLLAVAVVQGGPGPRTGPAAAGQASRYLGGSGIFDGVTAMAVAGDDLFVVGSTESADFPVTAGAVQPELRGRRDLFVARLDPSSLAVEAATFLGGEADERPGGVALGPGEVVYVAGTTTSPGFPSPRDDPHGADAFVVGLTRDLGAVVYALAAGGAGDDEGLAVAAGGDEVWLVGSTRSPEWGRDGHGPSRAFASADADAFVLRLEPASGQAGAPRRLGGTENDRATTVAISPAGAVVAGTTFSRDFVVGRGEAPLSAPSADGGAGIGADVFVVAVPRVPGPAVYATRLGGSDTDTAAAVAVDAAGFSHVAGRTSSADFPTTRGAFDRILDGEADAFVTTLSPGGDLVASTMIGGTGHDEAMAITTAAGAVVATGLTASADFPAGAGPAFGRGGRTDGFLLRLDDRRVTYARRLGGTGYDDAAAVAFVGPQAVALGGATGSRDLGSASPSTGAPFPGGLESGWVGTLGVAAGEPLAPNRPVAVLVPGWGGLGDIQTSCAPALQRHGVAPPPSPAMAVVADWLAGDGFDVWHAVLDTGPRHTASLEDGASCLARQLADLRRSRPGVGPVALVGYSLGGLVARAYVESDRLFADDVSTLVTLGAPHGGVPADGLLALGSFLGLGSRVDCATQAGLCEVTSSAIRRFENRHPRRRAGVTYAAISGAVSGTDVTWLGRAMGAWLPGDDDGLVPTASGLALRGVVAAGRPPEAHVARLLGHPLAERSYFSPAPRSYASAAYTDCLLPILLGAAACRRTSMADADPGAGDRERTPLVVASVGAGQGLSMTLPLGPGVGSVVAATWDRGPVSLEVTGPGAAARDPRLDGEGLALDGDTWRIAPGAGGVWTATVKAGGVTAPARVALVAMMDRRPRLRVRTDRPWYAPGTTALVTATIVDVPRPRVVARLAGPEGYKMRAVLAPAGPGEYAGPIGVGDEPGFAHLEVEAIGDAAAGPGVRLGAAVDLQIASTAVKLTGRVADRPMDADGDGRYEGLAIDVGVTTHGPRRVAASGRLAAPRGPIVASSSAALTVTGAATVTMAFEGRGIAAAGIDGPFHLEGVLEDLGPGPTLPVAPLPRWRTAPYRAADFRLRRPVLIPAILVPIRPLARHGRRRWP